MVPAFNSNNLVGTAGEYFVCAELCRIGYVALLTPKNNPTPKDDKVLIKVKVASANDRPAFW